MADVNDTNSTRAKFEREQELLEDATIDEADRRAIREFVTHRRQMEDKSLNTLISDIGNLRRAAERAETPLLEMDIGDARAFVGRLAAPKASGGYGLDPDGSGMFGYKRVLRVFFQWLDAEPHYGEYGFGERISLPDRNTKEETISKDELLTEDEIERLKRACMNNRDPVLIDFLADVGARISLATSLRVGDIDGLETPRPTFSPNTDALSLKGVRDVSYPILYSRAELREWVNRNHPDHTGPNGRAHDEAPLFPVVEHYDPDNREMMAAHTSTVRKSMKRAADRADIDVERVHPHHFRHVFMTRISDSELNDRDIEHMSMLVDDRMRMRDRYDHTGDAERNDSIFQSHGFVDPDEGDESEGAPEIVACSNCRAEVKSTAYHCPRCGFPLREEIQNAIDAARAEMRETTVDADERAEREAAADAATVVENDERVAEEFAIEDGHLDE
ncbi:tyrosine-type recombinase/integrase [Halorubrum rutilum]|uniref:Tyrosine-type recombinase/integrase n=1 Tax=Halorubrum rutilum TaxID=1364933 RepID=A0ABD6AIG9_9EURY|nr:site-specific integrase [Halorubrum rutilum]